MPNENITEAYDSTSTSIWLFMDISPSRKSTDHFTLPCQQHLHHIYENTAKKRDYFDASACLLTTDQFQAPPELLGTAQFTLNAAGIYVPDRVPIAMNKEIQELQEAIPSEVQCLSDITTRLATPRRVVDMHSLLSTSRILDRHEQRSNWHLITLISLGIITTLTFLGYLLKTCQSKLSSYNLTRRNTSQQGAHEPGATANVPDSEHSANDSSNDSRGRNVVFSAYPLQTRA